MQWKACRAALLTQCKRLIAGTVASATWCLLIKVWRCSRAHTCAGRLLLEHTTHTEMVVTAIALAKKKLSSSKTASFDSQFQEPVLRASLVPGADCVYYRSTLHDVLYTTSMCKGKYASSTYECMRECVYSLSAYKVPDHGSVSMLYIQMSA